MHWKHIGARRPAILAPGPMSFGQTTQRFFVEGEEHEAADWNDTVLPPDADPRAEFKSFDKIPRRRGTTIAIVVVGVGLLGGIAAGVGAALKTEHSVTSSVRAFASAVIRRAQTVGQNSVAPCAPAAPTVVSPVAKCRTEDDAGTSGSQIPNVPAAPAEDVATPKAGVRAPSRAVHSAQTLPMESRRERRHLTKTPALHGYVWSPAADALVPSIPASPDTDPALGTGSEGPPPNAEPAQ